MPQLSVIVPLYGFDPNREQALQMCLKSLEAQDLHGVVDGVRTENKDFEAIIVEQECDKGFHDIPAARHLTHIKLPAQRAFNKSWCMNVAARATNSDSLFFVDVDMMFGKSYLSKVAYFKGNKKFFIGWQFITFLPGKDEPIIRTVDPSILTAGGAFFVDKTFFWEMGGMNEGFFGYGGEDNDFWVRANLALGARGQMNVPAMPYALVHWYHDWAVPSPERFFWLDRTAQQPAKMIQKLRRYNLGQREGPVSIDVSDIPVEGPTMESKDGKGLL